MNVPMFVEINIHILWEKTLTQKRTFENVSNINNMPENNATLKLMKVTG